MKIFYAAEIVGKAGVYAFRTGLAALNAQAGGTAFDFVVACADGATGGNGLGRNHAAYLRKLGADVITTGDCCFYKKDLTAHLPDMPYVLRPENLSLAAPGEGARVFRLRRAGERTEARSVAVAVLLGQANFSRLHGESPFTRLEALLERLRKETPVVLVDFHAEATAEKQTLFALAEGRCSAVIGSHCRVQTADERVVFRGGEGTPTAFITDAGRTGSQRSVGGCESAQRINEYLSGIPDWTRDAGEACELQGVVIEVDQRGGAVSIERVRVPVDYTPPAKNDKNEKADE